MGPNAESNRKEISKFSVRDAEAYEPYEADLEAIVHAMDPLLFSRPAELMDIFRPSSPLYSAASRTLKLLLSSPRRAFLMEKLLRDPAQDILRTRFGMTLNTVILLLLFCVIFLTSLVSFCFLSDIV